MGRSLLAPVPDDGAGALDDLPGLALLVDLAEAGPLAQLHVGVNLPLMDDENLRFDKIRYLLEIFMFVADE